jgi:hypothetical protein
MSIALKSFSIKSHTIAVMKKDAPLAFRIPGDLKAKLQKIADREARSISQVCELLLSIGVETYENEGTKYLQRVLTRKAPR